MNSELIGVIVTNIVTVVLAVIAGHNWFMTRFSKMEFKVDTLWNFLIRQMESDTVLQGRATVNSPIVVDEKTKRLIEEPLKSDLIAFYAENSKLSETDFLIALETKFGERLLKEVGMPCNLGAGPCLIAAIAVAKGE